MTQDAPLAAPTDTTSGAPKGKFRRSWELTVQSWNVLRAEKSLVLFPIVSSIALLAVAASFLVPAGLWFASLDEAQRDELRTGGTGALGLAALFVFYFINYFVMTYFNVALAGAALERFSGKDTSIGSGLRIANRRLLPIIQWALLSATVGMVLKAIEERAGLIGAIVIRLIGIAWAVGTYFVVPILAVEGIGPIDSVKRSVALLKRSWGEAALTKLGTSVVFGLAMVLLAIGGLGLFAFAVVNDQVLLGVVVVALTVAALVILALVSTTLQAILQAAVYSFAANGVAPAGFSEASLRGVFGPKKKKRK